MPGGNDDMEEGEWAEVEAPSDDVTDTPDGGALVKLGEEDEVAEETEFYANLAGTLVDDIDLSRIVLPLVDLITRDKEARKKRDDQYEEGLKRTGLANDAPGGAQFEGASKVVHPMLIEACVDFASRAIQEHFPPGGPAKDFIPGKITAEKVEKAKRKTALMNWQMTVQCQEFRAELEQLLTQLPLGGAQYLQLEWDERRNRPKPTFIAIDDMLLPYAATNFYSSRRRTHVQYLTQAEYEVRVKSGMYRDVDLVPMSMEPEQTAAGKANDKIEGREATSYNEDGLRTIWACYTYLDLEDDTLTDGPAPYIITIDKATNKVLSLYRNWAEDDEAQDELDHIVEWSFIPWRGAYPIGLTHLIGMLSGAATGALRALLDSAHINNSQSMIRMKGKVGGQNINIQPTEIAEIEGSLGVDDIRKIAMPLPFNPPSPVLFELLGFLVDAGRNVVASALEDAADTNVNAPVGTTLARIEQGAVVYKAIHGRGHDSMARTLRILHRLNATYLDPSKLKYDVGEELATKADFDGPLDVVPVSDPNIFSEIQRFGQVQSLVQRADARPDLYDARKVEERVLETLKIPDPEDLLLPPTQPQEQNAVNENAAAALGRPITAFPTQDHMAHLRTHIPFMQSPLFGGNPVITPRIAPTMLNHICEHIVLWYVATVVDMSSEAYGSDIGDMMRDIGKDHDSRKLLDELLAEAAMLALNAATEQFSGIDQVLGQLQQTVMQIQQQAAAAAPPDPTVAALMADTERKKAKDAADAQLDQQRLQQDAAEQQASQQLDAMRLQQTAQESRDQLAVRVQELQQRRMTDTERQAAADRVKLKQIEAGLVANREDNQTAVFIEEMRQDGDMRAAELDALNPDPAPQWEPGA